MIATAISVRLGFGIRTYMECMIVEMTIRIDVAKLEAVTVVAATRTPRSLVHSQTQWARIHFAPMAQDFGLQTPHVF